MSRLSGRVTFLVNPALRSQYPDRCALTVVFPGVTGSSAIVYAVGVTGWTGVENQPDLNVPTDGAMVHMQLLAPPSDAAVGTTVACGTP